MEWTTKTPVLPGWYWNRSGAADGEGGIEARIVEVVNLEQFRFGDRYFVLEPENTDVFGNPLEWAGPISPPVKQKECRSHSWLKATIMTLRGETPGRHCIGCGRTEPEWLYRSAGPTDK